MKHFFDRTLFFFMIAITLIGIVVYLSLPDREPANIKVAALQKTELSRYNEAFSNIRKGDSLIILGQKANSLTFLVQTKNGERGYVPQEAIDHNFIVYGVSAKDKVSVNDGDTVKFISSKKEQYGPSKVVVSTANGTKEELLQKQVISTLGNKLLKSNIQGGDYYISKKKFEELYIGKSFDEIEQLYRPAHIVKRENGQLQAEYTLRVLNSKDGRFYMPTIQFGDGIATSCTYIEDKDANNNSFFLRYLPLASTIIDVDFFSRLISWNFFESYYLKINPSTLGKIAGYLSLPFLGLGLFLMLFALNAALPAFLFGLLRFKYPLKWMSNKAFSITNAALFIIGTYVLLILGLSYPLTWWYFIPIFAIVTLWFFNRIDGWINDFPANRCPHCKSLYTIEHDDEEIVDERKEWRKDIKRTLLKSKTKSWQTYDVTTTTYSDGTTYSSKSNYQNHNQTTNTRQNDIYNVLYLVKDIKVTYTCDECNHNQYGWREELDELDRKFKGSYVDTETYNH